MDNPLLYRQFARSTGGGWRRQNPVQVNRKCQKRGPFQGHIYNITGEYGIVIKDSPFYYRREMGSEGNFHGFRRVLVVECRLRKN
jgi:hypothetical protein